MVDIDNQPKCLRVRPVGGTKPSRIQSIISTAKENPSWTRQDLIRWVSSAFQLKEETARQYTYEASKVFNCSGKESQPPARIPSRTRTKDPSQSPRQHADQET